MFSFSSIWDSYSFSRSKIGFFLALFTSVIVGYVSFLGVRLLCI